MIKTNALSDIQWQKAFGGSKYDIAMSVATTAEGYVFTGWTKSNDGDVSGNHGSADAWMLTVKTK